MEAKDSFNGDFDILLIVQHLKECLGDTKTDVNLDGYTQVFKQLYKFFTMLGTIFGFVGSDIKEKVEILESFRKSKEMQDYETVEKMIHFEVTNGEIMTNKESSGCRTFLRLHRSLIFVSEFLRKTLSIEDKDGAAGVCRLAYDETLANFHPWVIRKGAHLAIMTLPTKGQIMVKVCGSRLIRDQVDTLVPQVIQMTQEIYNRCQNLYSQYDLLSLK